MARLLSLLSLIGLASGFAPCSRLIKPSATSLEASITSRFLSSTPPGLVYGSLSSHSSSSSGRTSRSSRCRLSRLSAVDGYSGTVVDKVESWLRVQTIGGILPKEEIKALLVELDGDDQFWISQKPKFDDIWAQVDGHLRQESRPLDAILRKDMTTMIGTSVESVSINEDILKAFMRTKAVESLAGAILYTGIFEFVQRADILGNIVNQLPVIGPVRQQVNDALKSTLDATLGGQIKDFLGTNSRPAVEQMIDFIIEEKNKKMFGKSARRAAEYVLSRPVKSLLPSQESSNSLRDEVWMAVRQSAGTLSEEEAFFEAFFDKLGDREIGEFIPDVPPTAKRGLLKVWQKFLDSESGMELSESNQGQRRRERDFE